MPKKKVIEPIKKKVNFISKTWTYLEPIWLGNDGKLSLRNVSALALVVHFMFMMTNAFYNWEAGKSLEGAAMVLTVEMGGILTMMGFAVWSNLKHTQIDAENGLLQKPSTDVPPEDNRPTE